MYDEAQLSEVVYRRAAPDLPFSPPTPASREVIAHVVDLHDRSCDSRIDPVFCPCGDHGLVAVLFCWVCDTVVYLLVRGSSWCDCAQFVYGQTGAPIQRWWS